MKKWLPIVLILIIGLFLRAYKPLTLFMYGHDQDLAGWIVKDVLFNHHLRLIGQETSSQGIFIGPMFYYLQIPFYLLSHMDPSGVLLLPIILSGFTIFSFYFVFSKMFGKRVGVITSFIYATSVVIVFTDRNPVPTMPEVLWTVWYLWGLWRLIKGKQKAYFLLGFLFGVVWDLNLSLAILSPLAILAQVFSKKKLDFKKVLLGLSIFAVLMAPFFAFEARHNFQQTKAVFSSFTTQKDYIPGTGKGLAKLDRVMQLVHTNTINIFFPGGYLPADSAFYLLMVAFIWLLVKKEVNWKLGAVFILWQVLTVVFFTLNSINVSEYYLNGMNVIWVGVFAVFLGYLLKKHKLDVFAISVLLIFMGLNIKAFLTRPVNASGYLARKAIVSYINEDAKAHGYPCLAVSYITSVGNDLGYRYFFWLKGMHVNAPISGSPVYTIVYPLSKVDRVDKTFGVIGLVLPDYERYTKNGVGVSCSGDNSNLTDPMFGYTE